MSSDEVRFAEAVAALTVRLTAWGVEEPHDKAHAFVVDMRRNGWRPNAPSVYVEPVRLQSAPPPADALAEARAALARAKAVQTGTEATADRPDAVPRRPLHRLRPDTQGRRVLGVPTCDARTGRALALAGVHLRHLAATLDR